MSKEKFAVLFDQNSDTENISLGQACLNDKDSSLEQDLANQDIVRWYLNMIARYPVLSKEETNSLALRIKKGGKQAKKMAREKMILCNLKLVVFIAKRFWHKKGSLDFIDLINQGNIGLMDAIKRFNPKLGHRFSSYAAYWIERAIRHFLDEKKMIVGYSAYLINGHKEYEKTVSDFLLKTNEMPSENEIAKKIGISVKRLRNFAAGIRIYSIDNPLDSTSGELTFFDVYSRDHSERIPLEFLVKRKQMEMREFLKELMDSCLSEKEKTIIKMRFSENEKTFKAIGREVNLTKQGVDMAEKRALRKLRRRVKIMNLVRARAKQSSLSMAYFQ